MPGVILGDNVIIGANSTVTSSIPANSVAVGSPAKVICSTKEYINKERKRMENAPCYSEKYTLRRNVSKELRNEMKKNIAGKIGYIE